MSRSKTFYRCFIFCCMITAILLIITVMVILILYYTFFKPKHPVISPQPVSLESLQFTLTPFKMSFNFTLGVVLTVENKNYGRFKYKASKAYVSYRGEEVGEAPIIPDTVPSRGKHNISLRVTVLADKLLENPMFLAEFLGGVVNFTKGSKLHGTVTVFKIFKAKASSSSDCDMSLFVWKLQTQTICRYDVKL